VTHEESRGGVSDLVIVAHTVPLGHPALSHPSPRSFLIRDIDRDLGIRTFLVITT